MVGIVVADDGGEAGDFVAGLEVRDAFADGGHSARCVAAEDVGVRVYEVARGLDLPVDLVGVREEISSGCLGVRSIYPD